MSNLFFAEKQYLTTFSYSSKGNPSRNPSYFGINLMTDAETFGEGVNTSGPNTSSSDTLQKDCVIKLNLEREF